MFETTVRGVFGICKLSRVYLENYNEKTWLLVAVWWTQLTAEASWATEETGLNWAVAHGPRNKLRPLFYFIFLKELRPLFLSCVASQQFSFRSTARWKINVRLRSICCHWDSQDEVCKLKNSTLLLYMDLLLSCILCTHKGPG